MTEESPAARMGRLRAELVAPGALFEVVEEDVRGHRLPVLRNRAHSVRELLEASARFGERTYMVDGDVRFTFVEHLAAVDALAAALQERHGVRPGDRVALFAANRWEWVVAAWALVSVGAIPAAYNGWWTPDEAAHATGLVDPVLVVGDEPRLGRIAAAGIDLPVLDLDEVPGLLEAFRGRRAESPAFDEDAPALLLFTSGTTGRPKAVTMPHRALVGFVQLNTFGDTMGRVLMAGAPVPRAGDELPAGDEIVLVTSPLFHTSMFNGVVLNALVTGTCFVLLPGRFDPERVLAAIEKERVTRWLALGSAGPRVCASPALGRYDTSSVRYLGVGGAPVSPAVQDALRDAFPSTNRGMGMGYSSTEGGAVIASIGGPEFLANPTSTGRATLTTQIEVRDPDGRALPDGEYGEVHVRSAYVMLGYWNDPDASAEVLKDGGWLAMGDIARLEQGLLFIDSRARDMILVSAENVSPTEVEYCLEAHPAVGEAAVFAVDDAVTGDAVCVVVTLVAGASATAEELAAWCREQLAHYKVPTHWHLLHEPLPRTASGKLVKDALRARVAGADRGPAPEGE